MSMNATDAVASALATLRATVDLPDPEPPATPMMSGFMRARRSPGGRREVAGAQGAGEAGRLSRNGIDAGRWSRACARQPAPQGLAARAARPPYVGGPYAGASTPETPPPSLPPPRTHPLASPHDTAFC